MPVPVHLAVALEGAGWHPAAWRLPAALPADLLTGGYWVDVVREAERGLVDFVTFEDAFSLQSSHFDRPDDRTDQVRGRLDAVLVAARVAPLTSRVGLIPAVTVTHTEPFHASKAIASLDIVSLGRGGVRVQVSGRAYEARHVGRRDIPGFRFADLDTPQVRATMTELFDEAADYVQVLSRLWDSWEDDAVIRDVATGRYVDRDKLHYIDFAGEQFSVKGPSITPRPPQGQPPVAVLAHGTGAYALGAKVADLLYVTPRDASDAGAIVAEVRDELAAAGRADESVRVLADLVVLLAPNVAQAQDRLAYLDGLAGAPLRSDAHVFAGTAAGLADLIADWQGAGLSGFRLRPAAIPGDLTAIVDELVPELQRRGLFRTRYETDTLRGHLGLGRPANRYEVAQ